jgi:hypothetical protein
MPVGGTRALRCLWRTNASDSPANLSTSAIGGGSAAFRAQPVGRFAWRHRLRFNGQMAPRFLTILTGRNLPTIRQQQVTAPSIINEKTVVDFTRVVEATGILESVARPEPTSDGH